MDAPDVDAVDLPTLSGSWVSLRPLNAGDYDFLYKFSTEPATGYRWRYRGVTPSPEQFGRTLWEGVLAQFVVVRNDTQERIGLVVCYSADFVAGHAYLGIALDVDRLARGTGVEAAAMFIDYLFSVWDFHKLYAEVPEYNKSQFAAIYRRPFVQEGRLSGHFRFAGRRWDNDILALYPADWQDWRARIHDASQKLVRPHPEAESPHELG